MAEWSKGQTHVELLELDCWNKVFADGRGDEAASGSGPYVELPDSDEGSSEDLWIFS